MLTTKNICQLFPEVKTNLALATLTTFGIGGKAKYVLEVHDKHRLVEVVKIAKASKIDYLVLAGGSNLVCADKPLPKLFIVYRTPTFARGIYDINGRELTVEAGLPLAYAIDLSLKAGLSGLETLSGIPGTVGGAVVGNAGAYGVEIGSKIKTIEIFDGQKIVTFTPDQNTFAYRHSIFKTKAYLVLAVTFSLQAGDKKELQKIAKDIIKIRTKKYPPSLKCPGSFFKNPPIKNVSRKALQKIDQTKVIGGKIPAGYLLEAVGAKGLKQGKIQVASTHGNLIVNLGGGQAKDVLKLADKLKNLVWQKFGIKLEEEVRIIK